MGIKLGGAHIDENGNARGGKNGDQTGREVSVGDFYSGWRCGFRAKSADIAAKLAQAMLDACENDNIGYNQANRVAKTMAKKYGSLAAISEPTATDCSELISACIWQATGKDLTSFSTYTEESCIMGSGLFMKFTSVTESSVYNGDILLKSGHTEMVVSGRPRTGQEDPISGGTSGGYTSSELYSSTNTRKDMIVREVGYLNSSCEPSMTASNLNLSVINYTTLLADLFRELIPESMLIGSSGSSSASTDTSKLTGNCKIVVDYFLNKGLNAAAACGIAGNINHESNFNTAAVGDYNTSFGICQWHLTRGTNMKNACGSNWRTNLTGQLDFLWSELNGGYRSSVLVPLQGVANTEAGCKKAADVFVRKFEIPANVDNESLNRQATAVSYFKQCIVMSTSTTSGTSSGSLTTQSGTKATLVKTVTVPSSVRQTGVIPNYTNYSYFYSRWSSGTTQRKLADIWASKGKKSSRNIATIDGYYLIAMSSIFATTGDIVVIELQNGEKIKAILGDSKGSDASSVYGHILGGGVDIIEWEATTNVQSSIALGTWKGQNVKAVHNYGSYLR